MNNTLKIIFSSAFVLFVAVHQVQTQQKDKINQLVYQLGGTGKPAIEAHVALIYNVGNSHAKLKEFDKAIPAYKQCLALDPNKLKPGRTWPLLIMKRRIGKTHWNARKSLNN